MKKNLKRIMVMVIACLMLTTTAYAWEGDCGYEGGISSGNAPGKTLYDYKELCFINGDPFVMNGTLTLKKSLKQDTIISTYTYVLKNLDKSAALTRTLELDTVLTKKDNGQTVEQTTLGKKMSEAVKIGTITYTLKNYDFTRTNLIDSRPAINYFAGNLWGKKTYQIGAAANGESITVEATGNFYGYDQYWANTEVQTVDYVIKSEKKKGDSSDNWGATARVVISSNSTQKLRYVDNEPNQISFDGGYVQTQNNNNIMEYSCRFPEFDSKGVSTDNVLTTNNSLGIDTFPQQTRLLVADISHIRGHWAENDVKMLYALEVFKGNEAGFDPDQYMTRAEFIKVMTQAAREVPKDPALSAKATARPTKATTATQTVLPFNDISKDNIFYADIETAFKRGLIVGKGGNSFKPSDTLTVAETLTVFVRALGLEGLAPNPVAVTNFRDNDKIPDYARNAAYVAEKIGLVQGDDKGYLNPNDYLTKAKAATLTNRFINYMRDGIRKDYRERIVNY